MRSEREISSRVASSKARRLGIPVSSSMRASSRACSSSRRIARRWARMLDIIMKTRKASGVQITNSAITFAAVALSPPP